MKILICGFMGSGKSTLMDKWKAESENSEWLFQDLDDLVFEKLKDHGNTLGEAIEEVGWENFRNTEADLLKEKISEDKKIILSLGGGTLEREESLRLIKESENTYLVYLATPFEQCWERVSGDENRPLVKNGKEFLADLFKKRESQYSQADTSLKPSESQITLSSFLSLLSDQN